MIVRMRCLPRRFRAPVILAAILIAVAAQPAGAQTVLITGANSGLGLEFTKQYVARGWTVIATHRRDTEPESLTVVRDDFPGLRIERMDVTSKAEIDSLAAKLAGEPIDLLINNAGVYQFDGTYANQQFGQLDFEIFDVFTATNIKGPMMVTEAFIDNVRGGELKKIVSITSTHGEITVPPLVEGAFWYGMSKAALNKMMVTLSHVLDDEGITVIVMHPGAVLTERQAHLTFPGMIETDFSVGHMIETIDELTLADTGKFFQYDGEVLPW
jgi:NAD(P)-dependent dehydrogenase (short-subunit alcohol dehydrogenase family)